VTADRLLLWRHGRTASNAGRRFQGQLDVPLDEVGRVQAKTAGAQLADEVAGVACRIVSSDLSRAHDTALALSERLGLPVLIDPRLREVYAKDWEGLAHAEIVARDPELFAAWRAGEDVAAGGGERRSEAGARTETAISEHAAGEEGGVLVVVSHGAALRSALERLIGLTAWSGHVFGVLHNAHWADLQRHGERWVLAGYNLGPAEGSAAAEG
jgi:glucosyl-3-phosphoglycerate phosphatase